MKPSALLRLALAGTRTDTLRVVLTAVSAMLAALALLAALTVQAIPDPVPPLDAGVPLNDQYANALLREPGLHPGVIAALLLLTIPVLALAGQCARIGAPSRDRRLAAIRLAGGTPRQTMAVAAAETGVASLLGTCAGLAVHLIGREVLHRPDAEGGLPLPTDVLPSAPALAAAVLGLPLLAALAAAVMLRRVVVTPLGVVRQARRKRSPSPWPAVLIVLGVGAFFTFEGLVRWYDETRSTSFSFPLALLLLFGGGLMAALGVVLGTGWISHTTGRVLHRFVRRPAPLLAARRLTADPWHGSRTLAALLVAVVFGTGAAAVRAYFTTADEARREAGRLHAEATGEEDGPGYEPDPFYLDTMDLVDIAVAVALVIAAAGLLVTVAEAVVSRRRTHAALTAAGVPRSVLGRALAWQTFAPLVPAVALATAVGTLMGRGYFGPEVVEHGGPVEFCVTGSDDCFGPGASEEGIRYADVPDVVHAVPVPLGDLALHGLGVLALVAAATGLGLLFLRPGTSVEELRTG
ncbi:FtsX-like permease family protein [Streptomyces chitinivorans]|uniref:FtsX-like permease family protein n=1 Tax=Streptomyces chitinivorans TaxID=1257027 RepID=A0ABW7HVN0_9ACTN|nr:ABC transporter permease [Streptomyces chitinivorans]MDH2408965.1 ABC transporter permease [Streptomyces chitinivorans]